MPFIFSPLAPSAARQQSCPATGVRERVAWEWDAESEVFLFSPEWRDLFGLPENAPLRMSLDDLCASVRERNSQTLRDAFLSLGKSESEKLEEIFPLQRRDGARIWILARTGTPPSGERKRFSGSFTDITVRLSARRTPPVRPRLGDPLYQDLLDHSVYLLARLGRELQPLFMNRRLRDVLTRPINDREAFVAALEAASPSHLNFMADSVKKVFESGDVVSGVSKFNSPSMDMEIEGEFVFWPEFAPDGGVISVLVALDDFTERIRLEQTARFNQRRIEALYQLTQMSDVPEEEALRFVVESIAVLSDSPLALLFLPEGDLRGRGRMVWSRRHYKAIPLAALPPDHLPDDCFHVSQDAAGNYILPVLFNGDGVHPLHSSHDGHLPILRGAFVAVHEGGRIVCMASMCNKNVDYDADDLRQIELFLNGAWSVIRRRDDVLKLKLAKENAERANRVKDQFLANISHELRTPLNGMLSMLQLLQLSELTEQQAEYARIARLSGQALTRIIVDILDFSHMEMDKIELHLSAMDIGGAIRSVLSLFAGEAEKRGLRLVADLDNALPPALIGDESRIRQILFNLVGNALKFTEGGGITVQCSLLPHALRGKTWIYLMVADTGVGMSESDLAFIFKPFMQVDSSETRKRHGTGLGLSIVKRLIALMGGHLCIESEKDAGTAVHISLPLEKAEPPRQEQSLPAAGEENEVSLDILVAEDDAVNQFATRAFLQRLGHRVFCVDNGRLALEALKLYPFHCLITDIQMPEMDGREVIQRIRGGVTDDVAPGEALRNAIRDAFPQVVPHERSIPADLLVAAFTAHAVEGYKDMLLRLGMDAYLAKPVVIRELADMLDAFIKRLNPKLSRHSSG